MQVELDVSRTKSFPWGRVLTLLLVAGLLVGGGIWWLVRGEQTAAPTPAQEAPAAEVTTSQEAPAPSFQVAASQPGLAAAGGTNGTLWIGGIDGLYRLAPGSQPERVLPTSERPMNVQALHVAEQGIYVGYTTKAVEHDEVLGWYLTDGGVVEPGTLFYDPDSGRAYPAFDDTLWDFASFGDVLYGISNNGIYEVNSGERIGPPTTDELLQLGFALFATESHLYAGTYEGIWRWDGDEWEHVLNDPEHKGLAFARLDGHLYASIGGRGLYRSEAGSEWTQVADGEFEHLVVADGTLYAGGTDGVARFDPAAGPLETIYPETVINLSTRGGELVITTREDVAIGN